VLWIVRSVPESIDEDAPRHLDAPGAIAAVAGLGLFAGGLIAAGDGWTTIATATTVAGVVCLATFVYVELRSPNPMLPPSLFASAQFTGANLVTFAVYAGLGGAFFLVIVNLQVALDYAALEAGVALLPVTILMLLLSSRAGALAQRIGPRLPMTIGPLGVAAGLLLLGQVSPGDSYLAGVLPGAIVFGLGLSLTVAPLTAAVLGAVDAHHFGVGSATNNAVARLAGLLAVAVLPGLAGVEFEAGGPDGLPGYAAALRIAAVLCVAGAGVAALTIRTTRVVEPTVQPSVLQPCHHPCRSSAQPAAETAA
jgi:hypothetical protein